jgi:GDPmannose 4,6-dehydratase
VARIKHGLESELRLGNLQTMRDWGFAGDYVRAMWLMLQQERADDYVIGTGETHSVEEFVTAAFSHVGLDWRRYVVVDPQLYRPAEVELLLADASKARRVLHWTPEVSFQELVAMMVDADIETVKKETFVDFKLVPPSKMATNGSARSNSPLRPDKRARCGSVEA